MRGGSRRTGLAALASAVPILLLLLAVIPSTRAAAPTLGPWTETTDYGAASGSGGAGGLTVQSESCVDYGGYVYCVGGYLAGADSSKAFYTKVSSSGVGAWTETTDYGAASGSSGTAGTPAEGLSCVQDGGYVYCVGGSDYKAGSPPTITYWSKVFYAPLTSAGIGSWTETTDYGSSSGSSGSSGLQDRQLSCVADGGYIYCVGGLLNSAPYSTSRVYFAQLSSSGVGPWTETTDYGAAAGSSGSGGVATDPTCFGANGTITCVGGNVGSGPTSRVFTAVPGASGVGAWTEGTDYGASSGSGGTGGTPIEAPACAADNGIVTCVGGYDQPTNAVYQGTPTFGGKVHTFTWAAVKMYPYLVYSLNCIWDLSADILICTGGNDPTTTSEMTVSGVWYTQASSATTTTTSATTTSAQTTTLSSSTTTTSTTGGGGGIPEFPFQAFAVGALTAVVAVSYLVLRRRGQA